MHRVLAAGTEEEAPLCLITCPSHCEELVEAGADEHMDAEEDTGTDTDMVFRVIWAED